MLNQWFLIRDDSVPWGTFGNTGDIFNCHSWQLGVRRQGCCWAVYTQQRLPRTKNYLAQIFNTVNAEKQTHPKIMSYWNLIKDMIFKTALKASPQPHMDQEFMRILCSIWSKSLPSIHDYVFMICLVSRFHFCKKHFAIHLSLPMNIWTSHGLSWSWIPCLGIMSR